MSTDAKERGIQPYDLDTFEDTIRKNLVWYRNHTDTEKGKLSQETMAELMNISLSKYGKLETGGTGLHLDDLLIVCNIHHIHLEDLLTKPGTKQKSATHIQFTDEQFAELKSELIPVVREAVRGIGDDKGKDKKRRLHGMAR